MWNLNESSGNAADAVASNTMTNVGIATFPAGLIGNCASLNGSSQYFTAVDSAALSPTGDVSMQAWMNIASLPGSGAQWDIFSKSTVSRCWRWGYENQGGTKRVFWNKSADGTSNDLSASWNNTVTTGVWNHIVIIYNSTSKKAECYMNNVSLGLSSAATGAAIFDSTELTYIGAVNGTATMPGKLDIVGIWTGYQLSSAEVSSLYNSGAGIEYPFTVSAVAAVPQRTSINASVSLSPGMNV